MNVTYSRLFGLFEDYEPTVEECSTISCIEVNGFSFFPVMLWSYWWFLFIAD